MFYDRLKYVVLAALLVVGLAGFGIGHWASASNGDKIGHWASASNGDKEDGNSSRKFSDSKAMTQLPPIAIKQKAVEDPLVSRLAKDDAKANEAPPAVPGRRREAVIRLPLGTFTKEVDAAPYGHGRLTWNYEEDRVLGLIEGSVLGFEFELATEAEYSLSSNGTIYGLLTGVRLNHVRLPDEEGYADLKPLIGLIEPLLNEVLIDLPFSYQFRVQGDRLLISNFRTLVVGVSPLGKWQGLLELLNLGEIEKVLAPLTYCQALGVALEGAYLADDAKEKAPPKKRPIFPKSNGRRGARATKYEWERIWFNDMPSHLTPERVHGGVMP